LVKAVRRVLDGEEAAAKKEELRRDASIHPTQVEAGLEAFAENSTVERERVCYDEIGNSADATDMVLGVWEEAQQRIVVRLSELATIERYASTMLHEFTHAKTGHDDRSLEFESALSEVLGQVAAIALDGESSGPSHRGR
jgi:hypothetical protein